MCIKNLIKNNWEKFLIILLIILLLLTLLLFYYINLDIRLFFRNYSSIIIASLAFIFSVIIWCFQLKYNQNKLFSELIEEYSKNDFYDAITEICKFVQDKNCEIKYDEIYDRKFRNQKRKDLSLEYVKLKNENETYWVMLDKYRRMLANYFVKINIFLKNGLVIKKLIKSYWNRKSIHFLGEYVLTLEYIGQTLAKGGNIEDSMKAPHSIELYNKCFIEKNKKGIKNIIKNIDLINIFYEIKSSDIIKNNP